jgi:hypothetical protein
MNAAKASICAINVRLKLMRFPWKMERARRSVL